MLLLEFAVVILWSGPFVVFADERQGPLGDGGSSSSTAYRNGELRIAIVGAGIAGASAAFDGYELTRPSSSQAVTIYERDTKVGGRVQSIRPSGFPTVVEVGATHFFTDDWCLMTAMRNVGLQEKAPDRVALTRPLTDWNGTQALMEIKCNAASSSWWDLARLAWKYGRSPLTFRQSVLSNLERWGSFASMRKFDSIRKELTAVGLDGSILDSATHYLRNLTIVPAFQNDIVQPCTRARFSQNLGYVRGLSSLIAAGNPTSTSISGGNSRLVERMIKLSGADLHLNSRVTTISPGRHRRYRLSVSLGQSGDSPNTEDAEFDAVVLAAPLQSSEIDLSDLGLHSVAEFGAFAEAHVTHFTTPIALSSNSSDLALNISIPDDDVFTTSTTSQHPNLLNLRGSTVCYRRGCLPGDDCDECDWENLYRVHSRRRMEDSDLVRMTGLQFDEGKKLEDYGISWVHRRAWPRAFPQFQKEHVWLDEIEIAPKLFYLSGAEDVISSMEMSCRMGRNVARRLVWEQ